MTFAFGYNTNGFAHHRLEDALEIIAGLGYGGVALTLDVHHLDPLSASERRIAGIRRLLERLGLEPVVETGARYLLDPRRKHHPVLVAAAGRRRRLEYLERAIDVAAALGARVVSFWSGALPEGSAEEEGWNLLADGCSQLLTRASRCEVTLGFEPEPGMMAATLADFERLRARVGDPRLALTADIGHIHLTECSSIQACLERWRESLVNVHIEDMRKPRHEHLMFGEGEIDFVAVLACLTDIGYEGAVAVELSRDSHRAPEAAAHAIAFLKESLP